MLDQNDKKDVFCRTVTQLDKIIIDKRNQNEIDRKNAENNQREAA